MNRKHSVLLKNITLAAVFCALAFVCTATIKIPVMFLTLDIKDSLIVLCTLILGPFYGLAIAVIVPLLELMYSHTGVYGLIMNILSSITFCLVTGLIYRYKKSFYGAIIGLVSGVASVAAVMVLANLFVTPYYMGVPMGEVIKLIPTVLLPFNLVKATLNGGIVLLLYKPISTLLKKMKIVEYQLPNNGEATKKKGFSLRSLIVTMIAIAIIAISLCVVFFVLK